ncbi:MAG: bifunctional phosphoribosyl-AMP cyclohydrolase/phosphoribosyl-ATP diphosphatase HisIE [Candidatus Dasytiphilus stammeri]
MIKSLDNLDWIKTDNMIPTIIQHAISGEVLMHAYMNKHALEQTIKIEKATFHSRTKKRLWTKGETSGNYLQVINIIPDCDNDALLILVKPQGSTCHLGKSSCFYPHKHNWTFIYNLEKIIKHRQNADPKDSYIAQLYVSGTKRIAQKVGEEGVETAIAALSSNHHELINEAADLFFHLLLLLHSKNLDFSYVIDCLRQRSQLE